MDFLVDAMHRGGPIMWPMLFLGLVGLPVPVVLGVLSMRGKRIPAVLWLLLPGMVMILGTLGTLQGLILASEAIVHASPETKSALAHAGMSVALYTQGAGGFIAAFLLVIAGWAAGLSGLPGGAGASKSILVSAASGMVLTLGGLVCLWISFSSHGVDPGLWVGFMLLPCGLCICLAALNQGGDDANRARLAETRFTASLCVLGSVAAGGIGLQSRGLSMASEAYAHASPETQETIVWAAGQLQETATSLLQIGLGAALVASVVVLAGVIRDLLNIRVFLSLGGVLVGVLIWGGATALTVTLMESMVSSTPEARLKGLGKVVSNLPVAEAASPSGFTEIWVLQDEVVKTYEDGAPQTPVSLPASGSDPVLLAIAGDTKASVVSKTDWAARPLKLKLLTWATEDSGDLETRRLGAVPLTWMPEAEQLNPLRKLVALSEHADGLVVHYVGSGEPKQVVSFSGLATELSVGPAVEFALLLPAEGWSVSDLVRLCSVALQRQMDCLVIKPSGEQVEIEVAPAVRGAGKITAGGDPIIMGALDKFGIDAVFWKNMQKLQLCYDRALRAQPGASGKIVLKLVISKDGSVSKATTKQSTMSNPGLEDCLNRQLKRFKFSEPRGGGIAIVSYPLRFTGR